MALVAEGIATQPRWDSAPVWIGRILVLLACGLFAAGCGRNDTGPAAPGSQGAPAALTAPAEAVTEASWAPDALEELVAPIALYPDQLVGQILAASINSQEVLDGGNWLLQNQNLQGDALDAAAQKAGFGPAMRSLVQFPTVVDMMCQQIDWTRQLGEAFTSDQTGVLDAVQRLRSDAQQVGNLKSTPQQEVETKTENDKTVIEVKPADPKVVYVPQYDPQVIYTTPPPPAQPAPPPVAATSSSSTEDTVSTGTAVATGLLAFGAGVLIGNAIHSDDYYPHYGAGAVYYGARPFYPPAYAYRPAYSSAFRPATRYASPAGYRYNYNNVNVNRNVAVNNSNYYQRFSNNQNLRAQSVRSPSVATRPAQERLSQSPRAPGAESWKGQSSYAGRPNPQAAERPNQAAGAQRNSGAGPGAAAGGREAAGAGGTARSGGSARNQGMARSQGAAGSQGMARNQGAAGSQGTARNQGAAGNREALPSADRATGRGAPPTDTLAQSRNLQSAQARNVQDTEARNSQSSGSPRVDRGYGDATRTPNQTSGTAARDTAFSGANREGGGGFDRASSARGHASAGGRQGRGGRR